VEIMNNQANPRQRNFVVGLIIIGLMIIGFSAYALHVPSGNFTVIALRLRSRVNTLKQMSA